MMPRPAMAALACRGCRTAVLRAALSAAAPPTRSVAAHTHKPKPLLGPARRLLSLQRQFGAAETADARKTTPDEHTGTTDEEAGGTLGARTTDEEAGAALGAGATDEEAATHGGGGQAVGEQDGDDEGAAEKPWFLEEEPPRHAPSPHAPALPHVPDDAPSLLEPLIKYVYEDMGLDELALLDLRDLDPAAALGPNLMMLFGTARSERHLHVASGRFVRWLRRNYKVQARADGLIGPGELKTKLRRLRKKAKLMGTNTMMLPGGDNGISTGWVCVNFSASDGNADETPNFDGGGRFSGFGAAHTGTTVVVQCMTESRRAELDLETLWQGILRRSLALGKKIRGEEAVDKAELEALVSTKVQLACSPSALQWQALGRASQQQRYFTTLARRLEAWDEDDGHDAGRDDDQLDGRPDAGRDQDAPDGPATPTDASQTDATEDELSRLCGHVDQLQVTGARLDQEYLAPLLSAVLQAAPAGPDTASQRLMLVDQVLQSAHERGLQVWSRDLLVSLIESVARSPAYGPALARAQSNLELLLVEMRTGLDDGQVLRLMDAYAHRQDWDRFWDAFRSPARFRAPRGADHYELAYRAMAGTRDARMCTEALRWVYPEMLQEEPVVPLTDRVYGALRDCILVADPAAQDLLRNSPPDGVLTTLQKRALQRREFVRVLREVESLRRQWWEESARAAWTGGGGVR